MTVDEYSVLCVCSEISTGQTVESMLTVHGCNYGDSKIDHLEHVQVLGHFMLSAVLFFSCPRSEGWLVKVAHIQFPSVGFES